MNLIGGSQALQCSSQTLNFKLILRGELHPAQICPGGLKLIQINSSKSPKTYTEEYRRRWCASCRASRVKLFPPKPWGAARGPHEEKQPPLWLTHGSRLEESCLIAIQSIFTLLLFVCRVSTVAFRKGELLKSFPPKTQPHYQAAAKSRLLFNMPFICPHKRGVITDTGWKKYWKL